jgi:nitroreductase/NAD-dependent dihydropyrimidine dehydrogenase PreA subunit
MVIVDHDKCIRCGTCTRICHEGCMSLDEGRLAIEHELCSTCTQCIAVCPAQALSWDGVPSVRYDEQRLLAADQLDELFKQRRTTRTYKEQPVDRALLEEIAAYGIYAPTNHYHLRALLIDDPRVLDRLQAYGQRALRRVYNLFYRHKLVFGLLRRLTPAMQEKDKVKLEACLERGTAFTVAPALIVVAGNATIAHAEASAQYALYNMILAAQVRGLGSTISGGIRLLINAQPAARRYLGLRRKERVLAALYLGHPAVKFRNKVEGKEMPIEWVEYK